MATPRVTVPPEAKAAYREIEKGLRHLVRSIAEVRRGLRQAERRIEADARARIRELRKEAKSQVSVLEERRREAAQALKRLSHAAGGSWQDLQRAGERALSEARTAAEAIVERFRRAIQG